jgi:zinc protease
LPAAATFELANGLRTAVLTVPHSSATAVQVWYRAGSKDEPADRRGLARLLERLMFAGTTRVPPDGQVRMLEQLGGSATSATEEDSTRFASVVTLPYLELALRLEADRMRHLMFRDEAIAVQKGMLRLELAREQATAGMRWYTRFLELAFAGHGYATTPGGTDAGLQAATLADLRRFYDTYYQPGNALVVVVGNVTAAEVRPLVERHFAEIPSAAPPPGVAAEAAQGAPRRQTVNAEQLGLVVTGYKLPPASHPDVYALNVAFTLLADDAHLKRRIREGGPLAGTTSVARWQGLDTAVRLRFLQQPGVAVIFAAFTNPAHALPVERAILDEIAGLASKGPSARELRRTRNMLQASVARGLESASGIAEQLGRWWILSGAESQWLGEIAAYEAVTAADVKRVIRTYLTADRGTTTIALPGGAP